MTCRLCQHPHFLPIANKDAKTGKPLAVGLCDNCGLIQLTHIPPEEELNSYYHTDYRQDYKGMPVPRPEHIYRAGKIAMGRLDFLKKAGVQGGQLLDVGAGGGEFVYLAKSKGFDAQGLEPNQGYSEYARQAYGCQLQTGHLNQLTGKFDVVTLFHVLEHLPDPVQAFAKLHSLLSDDGHLLVEVPWIETNDASPHNIYFQAHLYYYSVDTLIAVASRHFDAIRIDTRSNLRILFRARKEPGKLHLPRAASVCGIKKRMRRKGWFEYLVFGKGLLKPFRKLVERRRERMARVYSPREILNQLTRNDRPPVLLSLRKIPNIS